MWLTMESRPVSRPATKVLQGVPREHHLLVEKVLNFHKARRAPDTLSMTLPFSSNDAATLKRPSLQHKRSSLARASVNSGSQPKVVHNSCMTSTGSNSSSPEKTRTLCSHVPMCPNTKPDEFITDCMTMYMSAMASESQNCWNIDHFRAFWVSWSAHPQESTQSRRGCSVLCGFRGAPCPREFICAWCFLNSFSMPVYNARSNV